MIQLETLSERLLFALKKSGLRKTELAKAIDVSPQVIHHLCSSKTRSTRFAYELAEALGVSLQWLTTGKGPMNTSDSPEVKFITKHCAVPVVNSVSYKGLLYGKIENNGGDIIYITHQTNTAFATRIADGSMEPVLKKNGMAVIDIQNTTLSEGDIGFIYIKKFNEFLIRNYVQHSGGYVFAPYNTDIYKPTSFSDTKVIGKLIAYHWEDAE